MFHILNRILLGNEERVRIEKKSPTIMMRESINQPLHTGAKVIDALIPIEEDNVN
jgi:F0F1-type ATP synthase alpha subunit